VRQDAAGETAGRDMAESKSEFEIINYTRVKQLNIFLVGMNYRTPHLHSDIEICLVLKGTVRIITKSGEYVLKEDMLCLFNSFEAHELKGENGAALVLSFQISPGFCKDYYPRLKNIEFESTNCYPLLPAETSQAIRKCMTLTALDYFMAEAAYEFRCFSAVNEIFFLLLRTLPYETIEENEYQIRKKRNARMRRIIHYIEEHYTEKMNLSQIAAGEEISTTYLSHLFHESLNISFQDYVNNLRFEKAVGLLSNGDLRLLDISIESGFSDIKYLNRMFLQKYGFLPKEYRRGVQRSSSPDSSANVLFGSQYIYPAGESIALLKKYM
jgi:AraC-like DNA-binding protein